MLTNNVNDGWQRQAESGPPIAIHRDWEPSSELADGIGAYAGAIGKLRLPLPPIKVLNAKKPTHHLDKDGLC